MSNEEKAQLNFLLTKLRCQIEQFILDSGTAISPFTEMKYEELIDKINEIMKISIIEGDK